MSDFAALFAPPGGWRVRILDMSAGEEDRLVEEVGGFPTLMHANAFARAYVRDSVERCREPGMAGRAVLDRWFAWGEDAEIAGSPEGGWRSAPELAAFGETPAGEEERDWRTLDPRQDGGAPD